MPYEPELSATGISFAVDGSGGSEALPALYDRWIRDLVGPAPREARAACSACPMCTGTVEKGAGGDQFVTFARDAKCCTYTPDLPNYLAGQILGDGTEEGAFGRETLAARIQVGTAATPLSVGVVPLIRLAYEHIKESTFGTAVALRCPHYSEGSEDNCGIWRHRNAVCSTWFCRHVRGKTGAAFWARITALLRDTERELSVWAAFQIGLPSEQIEHSLRYQRELTSERLSTELSGGWQEIRALVWGDWAGRERELYLSAASIVSGLSWADVELICGPELRARVNQVRSTYQALQEVALPEAVSPGPMKVLPLDRGIIRVSTYGRYDSLIVTRTMLDIILSTSRTPVEEVVALLAPGSEALGRDIIRVLVDHGLLRPAQARG